MAELLSALCSAASENLAAVSVRHSLAETVLHLSVTFLRLIRSFHVHNLLFFDKSALAHTHAYYIVYMDKCVLQNEII